MARFTRTERTVPARFDKIGTKITGKVLSLTDVPVPEFDHGRVVGPKFDVSGTMLMQVDVLLDVSGVQTLVHTNGGVEFAIAKAIQAQKLDDLNVGDELTIEYTGDEDIADGLTPAKVYAVKIKPSKK